jgi:protein-S-isoprenylcysteine O-methyltransferase Ste14
MESPDEPRAPAQAPPTPPRGETMLPPRQRRRFAVETVFMRLVATAGIVGIGVALAAILISSDVQSWIVGLVVSLVSVSLAAMLWSSRNL